MAQTSKLFLELLANSAGNQVNANTTFTALDQLVMPRVVDKDLSTPPSSPANGAMYIVGASPTGAWAGKANNLAWWITSAGAWTFIPPSAGMSVRVLDEVDSAGAPINYVYSGAAWVLQASGGGGPDNSTETVSISSGSLNLSSTTKEVVVVDLNQNVTSITMPAGASGQAVNRRIVFTQSGAANFTVSGWTSVTIEGGTAPVAATGVGAATEYMLSNTNNSGWRMYVDQGITLAQVGQLGGFRNKLINGNFQVNQRTYVSGTATTSANQYTLDRWRVVTSGQNLAFSASGNGNQITAPAGGVEQVIEGINIEGGTYVLNWTGTATATVNGTARAKGETFTLTANTNATVRFVGGTVSLAQLELSTVATPFEHRPYGVELSLCQRYYIFDGTLTYVPIINTAGTAARLTCKFPVTMRSTPTVSIIGQVGGGTQVIEFQSVNGFSVGSALPSGDVFFTAYSASAEL